MADQSQIFQTRTRTRWQTFKWGSRVFLLLFVFALVVLVVGLVLMQLNKPGITLEGKAIKKVLTQGVPSYRESKLGKEYRGFRKIIDDKWAKGNGCGQLNPADLSRSALFNDSVGIRAAFYVNWDKESSLSSLQENISKLNLIIPEWFFIDSATATLRTEIEPKALQIMKASGIKIMPFLTNNINRVFRGDVVHRILMDTVKRDKLIDDIINVLAQNGFVGVNIDFEGIDVKDKQRLNQFQQTLYTRLHEKDLIVSQDVAPFDESYDFKALNQHNDYIMLMAYDEHGSFSKPGSISSQKWVEKAVEEAMKEIPSEKLILGMAAYGRDWDKKAKLGTGDYCADVKYDSAIANAKKYDSYVNFDNDSYNLNFQYYNEEDGLLHEVHFTDAVTTFNIMRFATEQNLAGTTIWRLGGEDKRIWDFYDRPMTKTTLANFDFGVLEKLVPGESPTYLGDGEILNVIATPKIGKSRLEFDNDALLISEEYYDTLPSSYIISRFGNRTKRKLVLSYDDGPDPLYTKQILDTLAYYKVPASFFVVGIEAESNIPLVKRIFNEGHELGNHTFTHPNIAKVGLKRAALEMDATRLLIECITGHSTVMFRAPFNADSYPKLAEELIPIALSKEKNYITIGESIDPEDWQKGEIPNFNADTIMKRIILKYEERMNQTDGDTTGINGSIILLHDAGGDRSETVKATGMIIRYFQARGYQFTTVADLLGKTPDEVMPPVPKDKDYFWLKFNYVLFMIGYIGKVAFQSLMIVFLSLSIARLILIGCMASLQKRKETSGIYHLSSSILLPASNINIGHPLVSIIVPAYNEEVNAIKSLHNLLQCSYPNFEIIFVDDGSSDATYKNVKQAFEGNSIVKVFTKHNGGKASALNFGIGHSNADYVVCIDADTKLAPDAVSLLMQHFLNEAKGSKKEIGAVAGTVKVGNEVNLLTKWQSIEYISSQNFDRRGFAYANAITVIPGAIGAFKKDALIEAGGFTTDTLAEDCDITLRILEAGYIVANEPSAVAYTEAPESLKQFMKQRRRWTFGVLQTFWKHKYLLFAKKNKSLGWIALPDILLFKYIIPFFTPLADFFMLIGLLTGNAGKIGAYYLIFMIVDAAIAAMAFAFEKENPWKLLWLIPQRLVYRWLMMVVLFRAFKRAIKGELQHWGVLKRTGNVKEV
jgi:cellulose synthase/poly-beta-1,6-N-acetylglucosamine synthase-like glycosyltransferase/spore germination protein YaaH/peptidoglycan/xylan/chitin deacetylase (PgdA/CDA1 family)